MLIMFPESRKYMKDEELFEHPNMSTKGEKIDEEEKLESTKISQFPPKTTSHQHCQSHCEC